MHSEKLHVRVQYLERKIMQLLERCKDQKAMIQQLQQEKVQLIQQGINATELVHNFSNGSALDATTKDEKNMRNWEAKIDNYIGDIDKVVAYFERL